MRFAIFLLVFLSARQIAMSQLSPIKTSDLFGVWRVEQVISEVLEHPQKQHGRLPEKLMSACFEFKSNMTAGLEITAGDFEFKNFVWKLDSTTIVIENEKKNTAMTLRVRTENYPNQFWLFIEDAAIEVRVRKVANQNTKKAQQL